MATKELDIRADTVLALTAKGKDAADSVDITGKGIAILSALQGRSLKKVSEVCDEADVSFNEGKKTIEKMVLAGYIKIIRGTPER